MQLVPLVLGKYMESFAYWPAGTELQWVWAECGCALWYLDQAKTEFDVALRLALEWKLYLKDHIWIWGLELIIIILSPLL